MKSVILCGGRCLFLHVGNSLKGGKEPRDKTKL